MMMCILCSAEVVKRDVYTMTIVKNYGIKNSIISFNKNIHIY